LLYSLLATIIQEIISTNLGLRAEMLKKGISKMLDDELDGKGISEAFYDHPLIKYLGENKSHNKPSYLNAKNFSKVLIDLLRGQNAQPGQSFSPLIQQALNAGNTLWGKGASISPETLSYLKSLWADAQGDVEKFSGLLEQWFDDTMERASGWFKRKTQLILFFVGLGLAIIFNIDSISIAKILSNDPKLAAQLADNASIYWQNNKEKLSQQFEMSCSESKKTNNSKDSLDSIIKKTNNLTDSATNLIKGSIRDTNKLLGLGWESNPKLEFSCVSILSWLIIVLGWLITALAISLGAPFWFDLLNKFMQLRSSNTEEPGNKNKGVTNTQPITLNLNNQTTSEEAVG